MQIPPKGPISLYEGVCKIMNVIRLNRIISSSIKKEIRIGETIVVGNDDVLDLRGKTIQSYADPVVLIQGSHWTIMNGKLRAIEGTLFECIRSSNGLVLNVWASGIRRSKDLFRCVGENSCYDTNVIGGEWSKPQGMTTPIVNINVSGPFYNSNNWTGLRMQTNGAPNAPVMVFKCSHTSNWIYGNTLHHINFEIPNAGAIWMEGVHSTKLSQINIFDADLFGNITDNIIQIRKTTGLKSVNTTIDGYMRLSGTMTAGKYDISIPDSSHYQSNLRVISVDGIDGALLVTQLPKWSDKTYIKASITNG